MSLRSIVSVLGGDLYDRGRRANIPAPGHSAADRSVSLLLTGGRVVVHAFSSADWREILDDLRERGLIDAAGAPLGGAGSGICRPEVSPSARVEAAQALWDGAGPAGPATLSFRHARLRGVRRDLPGADVLRHHPAAPLAVYDRGRRTLPALLLAIRDPLGRLGGVEITYLAPNGGRAIGLRLPRKTVGGVPASSAVRLDPLSSEMLVGEGVFTTLSASERFGLPGWALLSTRNLRTWTAPQGVRRILIAADRGRDGESSAGILAKRLRAAGLVVQVRLPPRPYGDWNEAAVPSRSAAA